jgi:hypothetical protein
MSGLSIVMKKSNISQDDAENIMIALDQVSQTIDVMSSVVDRLKQCMNQSINTAINTRQSADHERSGANLLLAALKNESIH